MSLYILNDLPWTSPGKETHQGSLLWPQVHSHSVCWHSGPGTICDRMLVRMATKHLSAICGYLDTIYEAGLSFGCRLGIVGIKGWRDEGNLSCFHPLTPLCFFHTGKTWRAAISSQEPVQPRTWGPALNFQGGVHHAFDILLQCQNGNQTGTSPLAAAWLLCS